MRYGSLSLYFYQINKSFHIFETNMQDTNQLLDFNTSAEHSEWALSENTIKLLRRLAPWMQVIGILSMIGGVLAIIYLIAFTSLGKSGIFSILLYFPIVGLNIWSGISLANGSMEIKSYIQTQNEIYFANIFGKIKSYFLALALSLIVLITYFVGILLFIYFSGFNN